MIDFLAHFPPLLVSLVLFANVIGTAWHWRRTGWRHYWITAPACLYLAIVYLFATTGHFGLGLPVSGSVTGALVRLGVFLWASGRLISLLLEMR